MSEEPKAFPCCPEKEKKTNAQNKKEEAGRQPLRHCTLGFRFPEPLLVLKRMPATVKNSY